MDIRTVIRTLLYDGFILVFNQDKLDIVRTAQALVEAGINNMEVTCRIKKPLEKLSRLRREMPDFVAGSASLIDWPGMTSVYNHAHRKTAAAPTSLRRALLPRTRTPALM